jgi:serine/threonine protein kinase
MPSPGNPPTPPTPPRPEPADRPRARGAADAATDVPATSEFPTVPDPPDLAGRDALAGRTFGDFELVKELGRGGMGVVYKARQTSLDRFVALKLLLPEHADNPVVLKRFLTEARAAARLTHPNIVSVYQVGEGPAGPFFVMELIDGPSLDILRGRALPVPWVTSLMVTVSEAVQHAHEKGVVHRDLKPGNIMLHQARRPVVLDFGIAKVMGKSAALTQRGALVGTPAYMSPEQAGDDPHKVGPPSDVYSLGAILYGLLTGRVPFDEGSALRTILKVLSPALPPAVRSLRPEVPARLEQLCMRCLSKDPAGRYPNAGALADDLRKARAALAGRPPAPSQPPAAPTVLLVNLQTGKQVRLSNRQTLLGRAPECDIVLKAPDVSKRHCQIVLDPEHAFVEDLDSVNGICVNNRPVRRARLKDGDRLDVAGHLFEVRIQPPGK